MFRSVIRACLRRLVPSRSAAMAIGPMAACLMAAMASITASAPAHAQYRYRTASGETVFSDTPPPASAQLVESRTMRSTAAAPATPDLPYGLKQVTRGNPVTLYTTPDCAACDLARQHLTRRGIPFAEKRVSSAEDTAAFLALGFADNRFPAMRVGSTRQLGYESGLYDRMLDAAGYPARSALPAGWKPGPAESLAVARPAQARRASGNGDGPEAHGAGPGQPAAVAPAVATQPRDAIRF